MRTPSMAHHFSGTPFPQPSPSRNTSQSTSRTKSMCNIIFLRPVRLQFQVSNLLRRYYPHRLPFILKTNHLIPYPLHLIPYPLHLIPYPLHLIPYLLHLIPRPLHLLSSPLHTRTRHTSHPQFLQIGIG